MALDPKDVYEFEMSHETGSSKNKLKVTTKFKVRCSSILHSSCARVAHSGKPGQFRSGAMFSLRRAGQTAPAGHIL